MNKALLSVSLLALFAIVSCKENASTKIKTGNVAVAAERDEAAKKLPVMEFEKAEHDFGTIQRGTPQETIFTFTNTGNAPLIIADAKSTCGCTVPKKPDGPIAPGEKGELVVKFNGQGNGPVTKTVTITANTEKGSELLRIKAFVNAPATTPQAAGPTVSK